MGMKDKEQFNAALQMAKAVYDDASAEINGRQYKITKVNHKKRRKVFSYFTHIKDDMGRGDMWFLDSPEWESVENVINNVVTFEDQLLSKLPDHWDTYPEDYLLFVQSMLSGLSYPFLAGVSGG